MVWINTRIESETDNGRVAMVKAWETYNKNRNPANSPIMKDIALYNQFDCEVLCDILIYLREFR